MCNDIYIISFSNGKLKLMNGDFEIVFQKKGSNGVKIIDFQNHKGGKEDLNTANLPRKKQKRYFVKTNNKNKSHRLCLIT